MALSQTQRDKLIRLWAKTDLSYNAEDKREAHAVALRVLRDFARHNLNLDDSQFKVYSNLAGPACSGEVTLYTNPLPACQLGVMIQIAQSVVGTVMFRTVKSPADYVGGTNQWTDVVNAFGTKDIAHTFSEQIENLICGSK
jgi:hypothetical protein